MLVKDIVETDMINYKNISMFIIFPFCSFKCDKECGMQVCQNSALALSPNINIDIEHLIHKYLSNPITNAIVCGGLEPFDSWEDLYNLIKVFRSYTNDEIVIYTGYIKEELKNYIDMLKYFNNIIIKFGRYIPNDNPHYDELLGVELISSNQYAERIS